MSLFTLEDRVVVVTGGRGQLGRQYTRALIEAGARVVIVDLPTSHSSELEEDADNVRFFPCDITNRGDLEQVLRQVESIWTSPFGLINNAALDSPPNSPAEENGPFESYPEESWDSVMSVNLKGAFIACQVFGGRMAELGCGAIVNISSIYGLVSPDQRIYQYREHEKGEPFFKPVAYSASKSGIMNLTRYLATYWAGRGVRVNTLTLGGVFNHQDSQFLQGYCSRVPLGRMAGQSEYNGAIIFLLSKASSYMTGSNLIIDGGWTAW